MAKQPLILGIETSCDETGVAVVSGLDIRSTVLGTQTDAHARFGGVVPEVAARAHVEAIRPLVHHALRSAGVHSDELDAIAATQGPGLSGALLVGFSFGKALAWSLGKPFLGIDHMEGHLFAPRLEHPDYRPPAVVLLASGGHSQIVHMREWGHYEVLGMTIDDAAGEAFDKLARFMGLGYPGGPAIDRAAAEGDPGAVAFPASVARSPLRLLLLRPQDLGGDLPGESKGSGQMCPRSPMSRPRSRRPLSTCWSTRRSTQWTPPGPELLPAAGESSPTGVSASGLRKRRRVGVSSCTCRLRRCAPTTAP